MKRTLFAVAVSIFAAAAVSMFGASAPAHAQDATVTVGDNFYNPSAVTVSVGDTVTWNWTGSLPHTVTASDQSFGSAQQTSGSFSQTFATAGTFNYFCTVHGAAAMSGTVTVSAAGGPQPTAPAGATPTTAAGASPTTGAGAATPTRPAAGGTPVTPPATGVGSGGDDGGSAIMLVAGIMGAGTLVAAGGFAALRRRM